MLQTVLITVLILSCVEGFPQGAPLGACLSMYPSHSGIPRQTTAAPLVIQLSHQTYSPSQEINVTLFANDGGTFKGIQMTVTRQLGETEELLGSFVNYPNKTKVGNVLGGTANCITHANNNLVSEIQFTWKAPDVNYGNLTFRATFLEKFDVFWYGVTKDLPSDTPVLQTPEMVLMEPIRIDYDGCGKTIGCLLYPRYCSGENCDYGITYKHSPNNVTIQMWAKTENYVSMGLSTDQIMGQDQTTSCTYDGTTVTFQHGLNPGYYNDRQYKRGQLSNMASAYIDGKLFCTFTRPYVMDIDHYGEIVTFDLFNHSYYVMIAWGKLYPGSAVVAKHEELPVTSETQIQFTSYGVFRGEGLPLLTQIHGTLMLVAWILFAGIATVVSRYYKPIARGKKMCGTDIWFQIHRTFAVLAGILTAVAFVIIFIHVDGLTETAELHGWLGIAVMAGVTLQVLGGLMRPDRKSSVRPVFNWFHFLLGKSIHIVAAVSCFILFNTNFLPQSQETFGTIMTAVWVGLQILWEVIFEVFKCRMTNKAGDSKKAEGDQNNDTGSLPNVLLLFYIITMTAMMVPAFMSIYYF